MKKILSSNSLKIIAILAMLLDHIAFLFIPVSSMFYFIFRIIGRVTAPIMLWELLLDIGIQVIRLNMV